MTNKVVFNDVVYAAVKDWYNGMRIQLGNEEGALPKFIAEKLEVGKDYRIIVQEVVKEEEQEVVAPEKKGIYFVYIPWTADDHTFDNPKDAENYIFKAANEVRKSRGLREVPKGELRVSWSSLGKTKDFYYGTRIFGSVSVVLGYQYGEVKE